MSPESNVGDNIINATILAGLTAAAIASEAKASEIKQQHVIQPRENLKASAYRASAIGFGLLAVKWAQKWGSGELQEVSGY